MHLKHQM